MDLLRVDSGVRLRRPRVAVLVVLQPKHAAEELNIVIVGDSAEAATGTLAPETTPLNTRRLRVSMPVRVSSSRPLAGKQKASVLLLLLLLKTLRQ